jgi:outer membrane protein TolC
MRHSTVKISLLLAVAISFWGSMIYGQSSRTALSIQQPLELQTVIRYALANNFGIQIATLDKQLGKLDVKSKRGLYDTITRASADHTIDRRLPVISVFGNENDTTNFQLGVGKVLPSGTNLALTWNNQRFSTNSTFVTTNPTFSSELKASLTQPLLENFFGRNGRMTVELAEIQNEVLQLRIEDQIETVVAKLLTAYWQLSFQQQQLKYVQESLRWSETLLNNNRKMLQNGLVEKNDVLAAEANRSVRKQQLLSAQADLQLASLALANLMNIPKSTEYRTAHSLETTAESLSREEILHEALESRRDLKILQKELDHAGIVTSISKNELLPKFDLTASLSLNGLDGEFAESQKQIFTDNNTTFFIGGVLTYNWENQAQRSTLDRSKITTQQKLLRLKETEETVLFEIDSALLSCNTFAQEIQQAAEVSRLQGEKRQEEERQLNRGRSDTTRVVQSLTDLLAAQQQELQIALNYRFALDSLARLQNRLLKKYNN